MAILITMPTTLRAAMSTRSRDGKPTLGRVSRTVGTV
jgi:hypothetical protein